MQRSFILDQRFLKSNIDEICHYGFTEILNNAIDHSDGSSVVIIAFNIDGKIVITIADDGEGIFKRIARLLKLEFHHDSILELSKGKLTTDPRNHSGEGIFFSSWVFDTFVINAGGLKFSNVDTTSGILIEIDDKWSGTAVTMAIDINSSKDLGSVFDEFSSGPDDYSFNKTIVPVSLAKYEGEKLVSRSQAKRLMRRVDSFQKVVLDFKNVSFIGQAFADEVFRVYVNNHPDIEFSVKNLNANGTKMMKRALSNKN